MPLEWSEPRPPSKDVSSYDHVVSHTPLGDIILEWKSWKKYSSPSGMMPWDEHVVGHDLDDAKLAAQVAWDRMGPLLIALCT